MDHNPPDNASEQTLPSQHAEVVSNLSTRPNYSERNEANFDEGFNQQRQFDMHSDRHQNHPLYSERVPNHRAQSFDQANNTASIHFSAPPLLNQPCFTLQRRENASQQNKDQNSGKRVFAFHNLDEDWEQEAKEKELRIEKDEEEFAFLLNQDNDPLLSQNVEVDSQFSLNHDNQPLLSDHNAPQHATNNEESQPLPQQSNQHSHELDQIYEADEKSSNHSQGARSNQVKISDEIKEIEFKDETRSQRSASSAVNVEYHQPLFETNVADDSQSNLLRFGFTRSGKKTNVIYQAQPQNSLNRSSRKNEDSQNSNKEVIPIEIDFDDISSIPVVQQQDSMTNIFSQDRLIKIQVHACDNQNIDNISKDNDIYGISDQASNQSASKITHQDIVFGEEKQQPLPIQQQQVEKEHHFHYNIPIQQAVEQQYQQQNEEQQYQQHNERKQYQQQNEEIYEKREQPTHTENIIEYNWTGPPQSTSIKIDQEQLQFKQEPSRQHSDKNEQKNIFKKYDQQYIQVDLPSQEPQPTLSLEQIKSRMQQIVNDEGNGVHLTQRGAKLLKDHFDFLFFNPLSDIGRQIISDGQSVVNLIKIILLKETDDALKTLLCKYLILTFASKVSTNQQTLLDYQQLMIPNRPPQAPSIPVENHIRVIPPPSQPSQEAPNSVRAVDGSSSKKQSQPMEIEGQRVPVKRTIQTKNLDIGNQTSQYLFGKKTRKRGQKSKVRTQVKKIKVKFEEQSDKKQTSVADEHVSPPSRRSQRGASRSQSNKSSKHIRESDTLKAGQQVGDNLGSKFTFVLRENNRSHQKQLVQKRVSQRLANKGSGSTRKALLQSQKRRSSVKKQNSSNRKYTYDEQDLNVSFIKEHLKQIRVTNLMMESNLRAFSSNDEKILNLIHLSEQIAAEESNQQSSSSSIAVDNVQHQEDTVSAQQSQISQVSQRSQRSQVSNTNSLARREEFKKNIAKYKVGEIPIIILRIVDPDINNHGIYALLELGKISQLVYNARFALTPITNLARASKKHINEDYAEAKRRVGEDEKDNMAYIQPTPSTLDLIRDEKERRQSVR